MDNGLPTFDNYKELACAVIEQQAWDFIEDYGNYDKYDFYEWCMTSEWFEYVNIDREYFYVKVLKKKESMKNGKENKHKRSKS